MLLRLHHMCLAHRRAAREKLVCWYPNGGKNVQGYAMYIPSSLSPPLPCSGSYLAVYTIFKSRLLKDLLGEKVQWNGFVQGNTVPWEYCSITE